MSSENIHVSSSTQRLYRQELCQSQYTKLQFIVLYIRKFLVAENSSRPAVRNATWVSFINKKAPTANHQLLALFLLLWYGGLRHQTVAWGVTSKQWHLASNPAINFYLLRYAVLPQMDIHYFVPSREKWSSVNPAHTSLITWQKFLQIEDGEFPIAMEDYFEVEESFYHIGFQLRCFLPSVGAPRYLKAFLLRAQHYPTVYEPADLFMLEALSLIPHNQVCLFDEISTARYSITPRKKRLLTVYKIMLKFGRSKKAVVEHSIKTRLIEQLTLQNSPAADFFQHKWLAQELQHQKKRW